jgi:hypothetical protein
MKVAMVRIAGMISRILRPFLLLALLATLSAILPRATAQDQPAAPVPPQPSASPKKPADQAGQHHQGAAG